MKQLRIALWMSLGALASLAGVEALLRVLPSATALITNDVPGEYPLRPYLAHQSFTYSYGWQMQNARLGRTNNYGHIAPFEFVRGANPVVVIGDSYVEAKMNAYDETLQGQLGDRLGRRSEVYGVGVSAMSLSDYGAMVRAAASEFQPKALVVAITDGDIVESTMRREGGDSLQILPSGAELEHLPRRQNPWMTKIRAKVGRIALYDYIRVNLKFSSSDILRDFSAAGRHGSAEANHGGGGHKASDNSKEVVDWFVNVLVRDSGVEPECIVLVVDSDRYSLYESNYHSPRKDSPQSVSYLIRTASMQGIKAIDLEKVFAEDYKTNGLKFDYWPDDRHWNARGNFVVANATFSALEEHEESVPRCNLRLQ